MAGKKFPLEILIGALDQATEPLKKINNQIEALRKPVGQLQNSFSKLNREAGLFRLQRSMVEVGRAGNAFVGSLARAGKLIFGLGLLQGVVGVFFQRFIKGAADSAEALAEMSDATGASVESLQTLGFVAHQVGVSNEQFTKGFQKFTKSLGELKAGTGPLYSFFKRIDPAFLRTLQRTKKTEDAFRLFIERLRGVKNESARLALSSAAFGKSSANFANFAKLSSKEMRALEDRARSLGIVSEEGARNADAFNDAWSEVTQVFQNLRVVIASQFFPVLTKLAKDFSGWLIKNRPQLEALAKRLGEWLPGAVQKFVDSLEQMWPKIMLIMKGFSFLIQNSAAWMTALIALTTYIFGPVVLSFYALTKAVLGFTATLLTTPWGWLLVGLAAWVYAISQVIDNWKLLKSYFTDIGWIKTVMELLGKVTSLIAGVSSGPGRQFTPDAKVTNLVTGRAAPIPDLPARVSTRDANVKVTFENMPKGARVEQTKGSQPVDLDMGWQLGFVTP